VCVCVCLCVCVFVCVCVCVFVCSLYISVNPLRTCAGGENVKVYITDTPFQKLKQKIQERRPSRSQFLCLLAYSFIEFLENV
jgi:hypothetical protein